MKKDEMMQGNNAALYQHLLRSGGKYYVINHFYLKFKVQN